MKARAPRRGSTLLTALGVTLLIALIIFGALAYTGAEQERSGRSVRDIDAQTCSESAAQWGRKYYSENYPRWNQMLSGVMRGYNNPESKLENMAADWGEGSFGRIDGQTVRMPDRPPDFRVTIADNIDEFPPVEPNPFQDNDLQVVLRAECLNPRLAISPPKVVENLGETAEPDPNNWRGRVLAETNETRRNKVVEIVLIHTPNNEYKGQRGSGASGDQNVFN
ncbi:hypothetical protein NR798_29420 [Archangium gephyra]|uniref:hypothetical protein n=1 Tax=Archangium gephyra TaxID=48 RepID=UPI0035D46C60